MTELLPTIDLAGSRVTRLIIGGNPISGFSHQSSRMDSEMVHYYSAANVLKLWDTAAENGINTIQCRGDRHIQRLYMEHLDRGGSMQWIAQTASEISDTRANVRSIASLKPIGIYHHGSMTDRLWKEGRVDEIEAFVKTVKDLGTAAGVGSHIPEVIEYVEEKDWGTDFYMCCLYNISREGKELVAVSSDPYSREQYLAGDPDLMTEVIRRTGRPCLAFKLLAAGRRAGSPGAVRDAFEYAFANIKPGDGVVVGCLQKHRNQVAENAGIVRSLLNVSEGS